MGNNNETLDIYLFFQESYSFNRSSVAHECREVNKVKFRNKYYAMYDKKMLLKSLTLVHFLKKVRRKMKFGSFCHFIT